MSAKDKFELGYGSQIHKGVLSYESVFDSQSSDVKDSHVNDRFEKVEGMHVVPPLMTGNYIPPKSNFGIDESKFTYGPKQSETSESDAKTSDLDSCESNSSVETLESMLEPVEPKSKVVSEPKVWSDAPILEEYESNSDDEYVSKSSIEQEKPSCAFINIVKHVNTTRQTIQDQDTCGQNPRVNKRDWTGFKSKIMGLGYGYTTKACFVCSSFSHLIRDYDFHEKRMAKQNKFVPTAILTKTGRFLVNVVRQKFSSQAASTSTVRKVNTARHNVYKSHLPIKRPFNRTTAPRANFANNKVNTARDKSVSDVRGKWETVVKASDNPHQTLKGKGIFDSGCSRYMIGNKVYLVDYQDFNGGPVTFGDSKGQITGYSEMEAEHAQEYYVLPLWSSYTSTVKRSKLKNRDEKINEDAGSKINEEPVDQEDQAILKELERLKRHEKEANDAAKTLRKMFAQSTEDLLLQAGATRASSTNYVTAASTLVNATSTLANQGDSQIPSLEDIYEVSRDEIFTSASDDDEGAVADFTNLESTMNEELLQFKTQQVWILVDLPFGKKVIRTKYVYMNKKDERGVVVRNKASHHDLLAFASYIGFIVYHMDVKSTFLYGKIDEEVYVSQPSGFIDPKFPNKVYKVVKASYGLHQAPRVWYATLSTFLAQSGYRRGLIDKTLFIKNDKKDIMLVQVYVDDIILGSTKKSWCDEFEALMKSRFQMSSIDKLTFFLGLQVKQKEDGIFISQDKYVAEILKKFDFISVKTTSTPIETKKPLVKDEEAADVDVHLYRCMIGSLMYLTASRPDIVTPLFVKKTLGHNHGVSSKHS
nr:putative ribonuclease H-like domain-containing protein [Tanacetum cinerariifolium]